MTKGTEVLVNIKTQLESKMDTVRQLIPEGTVTPERMLSVYMMGLSRNPKLLQCTELSLMKAFMLSAELGLEFGSDSLALAYIVPYNNTKTGKTEATFMPSYRGLRELSHRTGKVLQTYAKAVYTKEIETGRFRYEEGTSPSIHHEPILMGEQGGLVGYYAVAKLSNGATQIEFMRLDEVEKIRASSKAKNSGPWVQWFDEMGKKSVLKRLFKSLPYSSDVARAVDIDTAVETGEAQYSPFVEVPQTTKSSRLSEQLEDTPEAVVVEEPEWDNEEAPETSAPEPESASTDKDGQSGFQFG